jgi:DNA-binding response OmpR family regulator
MQEFEHGIGRILIVDDEEPVGTVLQRWLTSKGYRVRAALGFQDVVTAFQEEDFDLVTLDIVMPGIDGLETLRWIREHHPDVGVIMATGDGDLDSVLRAMRLGATNYVIKPLNMELIIAEIERGMERQHLIVENRAYQQELEQKVEERTREVHEAHAQLSAVNKQLARQVRELQGRDRLVRFQMSIHSLQAAHEEVVAVLLEVMNLEWTALLSCEGADGPQRLVAHRGSGLPPALADVAIGQEISRGVAAASIPHRVSRGGDLVQDGVEAGLPLTCGGETLAVLWVGQPENTADALDLDMLQRLADEAALVLRGAMVAEELEGDMLSMGDLGALE